jgi:uncharacterized cupredoxin-like copper-binding protein
MPFIVLGGTLAAAAVVAVLVVMLGSSNSGSSKPAAVEPAQKSAPAAAQPARKIGVTLKEFTVAPAPATGKAGKVTFSIRNAGKLKHEFVVVRTSKPAAGLLKGSEADESGNVGEVGNVPVGQSKTLKLKLTAGHYALICNLPGHYQSGQHADFTVR